jgi:hypothetical protein
MSDPNTKMVALSVDGKFETGFVIRVPGDATDDEIEELIPELICQGEGTRLETDEITEVHLTKEGTVSPDAEITTALKRTPAGELVLATTVKTEQVEQIVQETMARLQKRAVVVLVQDSGDTVVFHNCDVKTAKGILADAWAKLDQRS